MVSGTRTGRSDKVTGDEPGTCKAVTGTPYAGLEEAGSWCPTRPGGGNPPAHPRPPRHPWAPAERHPARHRRGHDRRRAGRLRGRSPAPPTWASTRWRRPAGPPPVEDADFPQPLSGQPWQRFSVQSPARAAQSARQRPGGVTGNSYEQGNRITGPFDMAADKVTGTEQFRFDRRSPERVPLRQTQAAVTEDEDARPTSRVTGEGISTGLNITGDDWDRGQHVTGTEGASARRRNPSRVGPMSAMPGFQPKRNETLPEPISKITGSSGSTDSGSLITVSGGARG